MTDLKEVTLDTIAGGMAPAVFEHLLDQVMENIADPNTDPQEVRAITLQFKIKPSKSRNEAAVLLKSGVKLASVEDHTGVVFMRHTKSGTQATTHDSRQTEAFPDDDGSVVDPDTGEVVREPLQAMP